MIDDDVPSLTTLIAGVGGQGVVLAGAVLAQAALLAGHDVRQSEMHGLSQRFGSVSCQIRIGGGLYSPHRGHGAIDLLVSLEGYEAFKQLPFLRATGTGLVNRLWRKPIAAKPAANTVSAELSDSRVKWYSGTDLTQQAECPRSLNFFMLGVLSTHLEFDETHWHEAIETATSKGGMDVNHEMFAVGRRIARQQKENVISRPILAGQGLDIAVFNENGHSIAGNSHNLPE
jgi:indolepyruvate ferredoxin oxidoreductase beta subunit